jgi:hypothetical protein
MSHKEQPMTTRPRYVRATAISVVAAAAIPIAIVALAAVEVWRGPPVEGSEAQGAFIFLAHATVAVLFVALAYPVAAWSLHRKAALTRKRFYRVLFLSTIAVAFLPAALLAAIGFGFNAFVLVPASFAAIALLSLPFRSLWFRLAQ